MGAGGYRSSSLLTCLVAATAVLASPAPVLAGGFEIADQGPRAAGRAGAFTVLANDVSAIEYNPAGLALVRGTRIFVANRFTFSNEEYRRARTLDWSDAVHGVPQLVHFDPVTNATPNQYLGAMAGIATDFGLDDWGFAIGVYGPPGTMQQKFPKTGAQKYMLTERETVILYYSVSAAWKYRDKFAIGVSLQWVDVPTMNFGLVVDGNVSPRLVNPVQGRFDMEARFKGSDHIGFSGILGLWYRPVPGLELAFSGRLVPVEVNAGGSLSLTPQQLSLDSPPVITRNGVPDDHVTFSFTLPIKLRLGVRYAYERQGRELFDLELDLGYEAWSMVDNFTMDGEGLLTEVLGQRIPIGTITMPRNWKDTWSLRLGSDVHVVQDLLTLRAGFFYESPAVPKEYTYIDILSFHRFGPSVGFSIEFHGFDFSAAYTYVFQMPVVVTEEESQIFQQMPGSPCQPPYTDTNVCSEYYLGRPAAPANAGTYLSDYHFLSVGLAYGF